MKLPQRARIKPYYRKVDGKKLVASSVFLGEEVLVLRRSQAYKDDEIYDIRRKSGAELQINVGYLDFISDLELIVEASNG